VVGETVSDFEIIEEIGADLILTDVLRWTDPLAGEHPIRQEVHAGRAGIAILSGRQSCNRFRSRPVLSM